MPIPSQNEFLLPFLMILSNGRDHTRTTLIQNLSEHFKLSETEQAEMSGNQRTLVSRVAWCDVHFVKAGMVEKKQNPSDSSEDTFRITSMGLRELNRHPEYLTVGYLQGFYRGKIYRGAGSDDCTSEAERILYERLDKLPEAFTVFHSIKWFARERGTVGEVDFLIAHREYGILVVEVKGGYVSIEKGTWYRHNTYTGKVEPMRDPCEQAERNRRALSDWLKHDPRTKRYQYALYPAVALPDSQVDGHIRPDCPSDIFIDIRHLDQLEKRLIQIFQYWQSRSDSSQGKLSGQPALDAQPV